MHLSQPPPLDKGHSLETSSFYLFFQVVIYPSSASSFHILHSTEILLGFFLEIVIFQILRIFRDFQKFLKIYEGFFGHFLGYLEILWALRFFWMVYDIILSDTRAPWISA